MSAVTDLLNGKADTNKLKNAAADILSTDAAILSDSCISKMYGNGNNRDLPSGLFQIPAGYTEDKSGM